MTAHKGRVRVLERPDPESLRLAAGRLRVVANSVRGKALEEYRARLWHVADWLDQLADS